MKLVKTANGKTKIKMSRSEWESMGKKAGWISSSVNSQSKLANSSKNDQLTKKANEQFNQLMEIMIRFEKSLDKAIMDGQNVSDLVQSLKREIEEKGLQEEFKRHGEPHIDFVIKRAKEKAERYSQSGPYGLFDEGLPFEKGWVIGRDNTGNPQFGPKEIALRYDTYGEAESMAKRFDMGLSVEKL